MHLYKKTFAEKKLSFYSTMDTPIEFISYQPNEGGFQRSTRRRIARERVTNVQSTTEPTTSGLQYHFYRPRNPAPFADLDIAFTGPVTFYGYQDLGDDGGFNVRLSGPAQDVELAVRTVYEMKEIPEEPTAQDIMEVERDHDEYDELVVFEEVEVTETPAYTWTKRYSPKKVSDFLDAVVNQGVSVVVAASKHRIGQASAYAFRNEYLQDRSILPGYKLTSEVHRPSHNQKIQQVHTDFIEALIRENPLRTIKEMRFKLLESFQSNTILICLLNIQLI